MEMCVAVCQDTTLMLLIKLIIMFVLSAFESIKMHNHTVNNIS